MTHLAHAVLVGIVATVVMDAWGVVRQRLFAVPRLDYALLGRWVGHMPHGRFRHDAIARARRVRGERIIGWTSHYVIGISFAGLLVLIWGPAWLDRPALGPAMVVGVGTVAAPLLLMQPGMGLGIAASRAPNPVAARVHSLITHAIYGLGLYAAGWAVQLLTGAP